MPSSTSSGLHDKCVSAQNPMTFLATDLPMSDRFGSQRATRKVSDETGIPTHWEIEDS
jgi:hypothetical protein